MNNGIRWEHSKTLQDYLKHIGLTEVIGPKPVIQQSFQSGYIQDGDGYYQLFKDLQSALDRFRVNK